MGRRLISKDEQIKKLENETRERCIEDLTTKSFDIMYSAGVLRLSNPANIESVIGLFRMTMEGFAEFTINLPLVVTDVYCDNYNISDRTVSNICSALEDIDSCIKCNDETKEAMINLLNAWQLNWFTYRLKKAEISGVIGRQSKLVVDKENGVIGISVEK